jgi:hypothetical protein
MKDYSLHVSRYRRHLSAEISSHPKIREARLTQKISACEAAEKMAWKTSGWYKAEGRIESGTISVKTLKQMARAVNCRVDIRIYPDAGFRKLQLINRYERFRIFR